MNDKVKELTAKLEKGMQDMFQSDRYKAYLDMQARFYNYSFNNCMLIMLQNPNASYVAGFSVWKKLGRAVKRGEHGISIIAPCFKKIQNADGEEEKLTYFRAAYVFDIEQTEGEELPELVKGELKGEQDCSEMLRKLAEIAPCEITYTDITGGAKGRYLTAERRIEIKQEMSGIQTVKTTIHEIAHSMLHAAPCDKDKRTKEVEAESVAYIVSNYLGIDTSEYSFGYIAGWAGDQEQKKIKDSLATIQKCAAEIIENYEKMC